MCSCWWVLSACRSACNKRASFTLQGIVFLLCQASKKRCRGIMCIKGRGGPLRSILLSQQHISIYKGSRIPCSAAVFQVVTHSLYLFLNPTHFMLSSRILHTTPPPTPPKNKKNPLVSSAQKCWSCCFVSFPFLPLYLRSLFLSLVRLYHRAIWQLSSLLSRPQICISRFAGSPVHQVLLGQTTQAARLKPTVWRILLINNNRLHVHA